MEAQVTSQASLMVDSDRQSSAPGSIGVYSLDPDAMLSLGRYTRAGGLLQSILQVTVVATRAPDDDDLPEILGRYQVLKDGVRFIPHFPFERGISYRASFDPRPLGRPQFSEVLTLEFSLPREQSALRAEVKHIFPSASKLPENLLRFYVCFSQSMQRGRVNAEISLLYPNGKPAPDALYRAPVELWDRRMQQLTVLLDPGRLKRGVGPNRALGPPLNVGRVYTLAIGAGLTDSSGAQLSRPVYKHFRVTDAVREPIAIEEWKIVSPRVSSRDPLVLMFPRPLDWALLSNTITIASPFEPSVTGFVEVDQCERRWCFTPTSPWGAANYHIRVASSLEDVCGNSMVAAFDRPLRAGRNLACEVAHPSISFQPI